MEKFDFSIVVCKGSLLFLVLVFRSWKSRLLDMDFQNFVLILHAEVTLSKVCCNSVGDKWNPISFFCAKIYLLRIHTLLNPKCLCICGFKKFDFCDMSAKSKRNSNYVLQKVSAVNKPNKNEINRKQIKISLVIWPNCRSKWHNRIKK